MSSRACAPEDGVNFSAENDELNISALSQDIISIRSSPEPSSLSETKISGSIALEQQTASRLSEEIQCCICLDILLHPRTLNPCGHSFCGPCLKTLDSCPQCRENIQSHVPARQLENLVTTLMSVPNLLDADDVKHYNERKQANPKFVSMNDIVTFHSLINRCCSCFISFRFFSRRKTASDQQSVKE